MGQASYEDVFGSAANLNHTAAINEAVKKTYSNQTLSPAAMKKEFQSILADINAHVAAVTAIIARLS